MPTYSVISQFEPSQGAHLTTKVEADEVVFNGDNYVFRADGKIVAFVHYSVFAVVDEDVLVGDTDDEA